MGGYLPGKKVTEEIAKIRGKEIGKDIISPSKFEEINTKEELKTFARITGNNDIYKLSNYDIATTNSEISKNTNIMHV